MNLSKRDLAQGLALLALWSAFTAYQYLGDWAPDMSAVYFAARFFGLGAYDLVYASPMGFFGADHPLAWQAEAAALGYPGAQTFPYIYPPLWAALLSPVALRVDPVTFFAMAWVIQIGMMAASVWLAWQIMRPKMSFTLWSVISIALLCTSVIAYLALRHNQPQITVAFLCLLAFERLGASRPRAAGIAMGLAAALKLTPILLLAVFFAERQYRAAKYALATVCAMVGLSYLIAGVPLHSEFMAQIKVVSERLVMWDFNFSLRSILWQISEVASGTTIPRQGMDEMIVAPTRPWIAISAAVVLLVVGTLLIQATQPLPTDQRLKQRLLGGFILLTLCAPLSWAHQYLVLLFLLPGLPAIAPSRSAWTLIALFGILLSTAAAPHISSLPLQLNPMTLAGIAVMAALISVSLRSAQRDLRTQSP